MDGFPSGITRETEVQGYRIEADLRIQRAKWMRRNDDLGARLGYRTERQLREDLVDEDGIVLVARHDQLLVTVSIEISKLHPSGLSE